MNLTIEMLPMRAKPGEMSDEDREDAIRRAGDVIAARYAVWSASGCFAARGDADRACALLAKLVKGRSPEQVRRMEAERGLR